jgi:hypothetical protein
MMHVQLSATEGLNFEPNTFVFHMIYYISQAQAISNRILQALAQRRPDLALNNTSCTA